MKNYLSRFLLTLVISLNVVLFAQEADEEAVEVSTVEQLLMLVKEGKTQEQSANSAREAKTLNISLPCGVVVSIGSLRLTNPIFLLLRSLTVLIK